MKKRTMLTVLILLCLALLMFAQSSCTYKIVGKVSKISGDTVKVKKHVFIVPGNDLKEGQIASFTRTIHIKKVNSKKVN